MHIRLCKFYNQGICSHDLDYVSYRHICTFCYKQKHNTVHSNPVALVYNNIKTGDNFFESFDFIEMCMDGVMKSNIPDLYDNYTHI